MNRMQADALARGIHQRSAGANKSDVSQMTADEDARPKLVMSCGSGRDSEETLDKLGLADHIALQQPSDLAFAKDIHRNRSQRCFR